MKNFKRYFIAIIATGVLLFITVYLSLAFYVAHQAEQDTKTKSDAILVLGARSYINGTYNPCLLARVTHAVVLYKEDYAPTIIVSGGNDREDNANEAETMKKIAMQSGVPSKAILLEKKSTSTYENFLYSQRIMQANHIRSIIIDTEPYHMARAELVAKKLGIHYTVSPASDSPCWQPNHYFTPFFLKEPLAIMGYKIEDKL